MNSLLSYLHKCNDFIGNVTIDQAFIDYRDQMKWKFQSNGRDENTRTMHADCLIIEYSIVQAALAEESYCKEFDIELRQFNAKVDIKIVDKWFNVPSDKVEWYVKNIAKGMLSHFAFFQWTVKPTKPLVVGDKVSFKLLEVRPAREVMENLSKSQYDGYYYTPKK